MTTDTKRLAKYGLIYRLAYCSASHSEQSVCTRLDAIYYFHGFVSYLLGPEKLANKREKGGYIEGGQCSQYSSLREVKWEKYGTRMQSLFV